MNRGDAAVMTFSVEVITLPVSDVDRALSNGPSRHFVVAQ
jgi:hypothetical protein